MPVPEETDGGCTSPRNSPSEGGLDRTRGQHRWMLPVELLSAWVLAPTPPAVPTAAAKTCTRPKCPKDPPQCTALEDGIRGGTFGIAWAFSRVTL